MIGDDLGPLPLAHPRQVPTERARRDLFALFVDWQERHKLTTAEGLMLLAEVLHGRLAWAVRKERGR